MARRTCGGVRSRLADDLLGSLSLLLFSLLHGPDLLWILDAIDEQSAQAVIDLVLEDTCQESLRLDADLVTRTVQRLHGDRAVA